MGADGTRRPVDEDKVPAGDELVRVTVTMTRGQHRALKRAAQKESATVSALVRRWINAREDEQ